MKPLTSALKIRSKDLSLNGEAAELCMREIGSRPINFIIDIRYGLGGWARIASDLFPDAALRGYEYNEATYKAAWKPPGADIIQGRSPSLSKRVMGPLYCDLLLADFNTVTMLKRKELDLALVNFRPRWLIF